MTLRILSGLLLAATVACATSSDLGDANDRNDADADAGGSSSGRATSSSSSGGSSSSGSSSSSSSGSLPDAGNDAGLPPEEECALQVSALPFTLDTSSATGAVLSAFLGEVNDNYLEIELRNPAPGTYDLATETQYQSCDHCVTAHYALDMGSPQRQRFFQLRGTLTIDPASDFDQGVVVGSYAGLHLTQVTVVDGVSEPAGGACLGIADDTFDLD